MPAIDLLQALDLPANHSRYIGVALAQGNENKMAYQLSEYILEFFILYVWTQGNDLRSKRIVIRIEFEIEC